MNRLLSTIVASLWLVGSVNAQIFETKTGEAKFLSDAPIEKFTGVSKQLTGRLDTKTDTVDFFIDLNSLKTGVSMRDEHMRENYLETKKFPFAEFYGKIDKKPDYTKFEKQPVTVTGKFTIHGVSKTMTINGFITPSKNGLLVEAAWTVKLSDHNIPIPSIVIRKLSEIQEVSVRAEMKKTND